MTSDKSLVMDGSFENFSKEEVFDVVGLTRQCMEVVFDGDSVLDTGKLLVKAGRVLEATLPPDEGGKNAFVRMYREPANGFRIYTRPLPSEVRPLGTLAELIHEARQDTRPLAQTIMGGKFADFSIEEVLDVLSLSRSTMEVQVVRADESVGALTCKAGRVLGARVGTLSGLEAFFDLFCDPGVLFRVLRVPDTDSPQPIGSMIDLVARGREKRDAAAASDEGASGAMMEGHFGDISIDEVFQVISLSRQLLEVVLYDDSGTVGAILVKSGQLLDAQAVRRHLSGAEAFLWLARNHGTRFSVVNRRRSVHGDVSLGSLRTLLESASASEVDSGSGQEAPTVTTVMEGDLDDLTLLELFDVLSLSRQRLRLTLLNSGQAVGSTTVKAGRVLDARVSDQTGFDAFNSLFRASADGFVVERVSDSSAADSSGLLHEWVAEAQAGLARAEQPDLAADGVLMAGRFEHFSINEVFDVISLSRQLLVVEFSDANGSIGSIRVKAGRVLACTAGQQTGELAFRALTAAPGDQFAVRLDGAGEVGAPLGMLHEWLAAPAPERTPKRQIIMAGSLDEFSLLEVLQVVSLSRQLIEVSLRRSDKTRGALLVKAGRVLMARTRESGKDWQAAVDALVSDPGDEFVVMLSAWDKKLPTPLMSIHEIAERLTPAAEPQPSKLPPTLGEPEDDWDDEEDATIIAPLGGADQPTVMLDEAATSGLAQPDVAEPQVHQDPTVAIDDVTRLASMVEELRKRVDAMALPNKDEVDAALQAISRMGTDASTADIDAAVEQALARQGTGRGWLVLLVVMQGLTLLAVLILFASSWM